MGGLGSDFVFKTSENISAIAIAAINPTFVGGNLQPYAGMPRRCATAVAGHAVCVNDAGFGRVRCHGLAFGMVRTIYVVMANAAGAGKGQAYFIDSSSDSARTLAVNAQNRAYPKWGILLFFSIDLLFFVDFLDCLVKFLLRPIPCLGTFAT